jgi:hypothetical protein
MPTDKDFKRLRGRHPDTAALTRLLAALGVTDPATGRPLGEATALGVAGGVGFAYFVFEYEEQTTLYLGGRVSSYVQKQDATEAALARLGVPFQTRKTRGAATAERQLRAALDQGRPVIVIVDAARFGDRSIPDWLCGMLPQDVLVEPATAATRGCGTWPRRRSPSPGPSWPRPGSGSPRPATGWSWPSPTRGLSTWPGRPPPGSPSPGGGCWSRRCATSACPVWPRGPTC